MIRRGFHPDEVLFSPTTACNLHCAHCDVTRVRRTLPASTARRFLSQSKALGVERIGFTGGEPFLQLDFLCSLSRHAVKLGMLFDRLMTNGVWWRREQDLSAALTRLYRAGFDGEICVSVDAFHRQDVSRVAQFIAWVVEIWDRPDMVSIARVVGARDGETRAMIRQALVLARQRVPGIRVRLVDVELAAVGRAASIRSPWKARRWFVDDYCQGPGNVFAVFPDGSVKPCCGYANEQPELTLGKMGRDTPQALLQRAQDDPLVRAIFHRGLGSIRKRLERLGVRFPGRTGSHCVFCHYILTEVPPDLLEKALRGLTPPVRCVRGRL
jgi:hypothetical protein